MSSQKLIKCGKLYDGIKDEFQESMEILISGNRIEEVGRNLPCAEDAEVIDLSNLTVTPGLIDAHIHPDIMNWKTSMQDLMAFGDNWKVLATARTAEKSLRRGFTSIRCTGILGKTHYYPDVRRAIDMGYYTGARMVIAATCGTPGSHGDPDQLFASDTSGTKVRPSTFIGNGPDFFRGAVREQKKLGYDFIKLFATGGFGTPNDSVDEKQFCDAELAAIMETAHDLGMTVTAHAYTADLIKCLVNHGIDGIEHGSMLDEEAAELMEKKGTYLVPTFCPYEDIMNIDEESLAKKPKFFADKLRKYAVEMVKGREIIKNSNIKMGYGTDFVAVHNSYDSGYEYEAWMKAGMGPFRALRAATETNASILRRPAIGQIKKGMLADLAAWNRDLMTDPKALLDCAFVMKDGVVYTTEKTE